VLGDFTEKHIVVCLYLGVDRLAGRDGSHKVDTLAAELDFLTVGYVELLAGVLLVFDFSALCDLVGLLVVDEDLGGGGTCHPAF